MPRATTALRPRKEVRLVLEGRERIIASGWRTSVPNTRTPYRLHVHEDGERALHIDMSETAARALRDAIDAALADTTGEPRFATGDGQTFGVTQ